MSERYTVYRTYVEGQLLYSGDSLEEAIRQWNAATHKLGHSVPGGVSVATYSEESYGPLQLRDGWILHVHEDGTTYLHPRVLQEATTVVAHSMRH